MTLVATTHPDDLTEDVLPQSELENLRQKLVVVDPQRLPEDEADKLRQQGWDVPSAEPTPSIWK